MANISSTTATGFPANFSQDLYRSVFSYLPPEQIARISSVCQKWNNCSKAGPVWENALSKEFAITHVNSEANVEVHTEHNTRATARKKIERLKELNTKRWQDWNIELKKLIKHPLEKSHHLIDELTRDLIATTFNPQKGYRFARLIKKCIDVAASTNIGPATFPGNTILSRSLKFAITKTPINWRKASSHVFGFALKGEELAAAMTWLGTTRCEEALFLGFRNVCFAAPYTGKTRAFQRVWDANPQNHHSFYADMEVLAWQAFQPAFLAHHVFIDRFFFDSPQGPLLQAFKPVIKDESTENPENLCQGNGKRKRSEINSNAVPKKRERLEFLGQLENLVKFHDEQCENRVERYDGSAALKELEAAYVKMYYVFKELREQKILEILNNLIKKRKN